MRKGLGTYVANPLLIRPGQPSHEVPLNVSGNGGPLVSPVGPRPVASCDTPQNAEQAAMMSACALQKINQNIEALTQMMTMMVSDIHDSIVLRHPPASMNALPLQILSTNSVTLPVTPLYPQPFPGRATLATRTLPGGQSGVINSILVQINPDSAWNNISFTISINQVDVVGWSNIRLLNNIPMEANILVPERATVELIGNNFGNTPVDVNGLVNGWTIPVRAF